MSRVRPGRLSPGRKFDAASLLLRKEIGRRLSYLCDVGLDYLSLNRQSRTLSGGEVARAMLTRALGSNLIETLALVSGVFHLASPERFAGFMRATARGWSGS